ncbi:P-loop containing nucleoside triphosphate hydrolase protein [Cucurbitaria berberidis CBS 394.84]|uniref:P-loop containing nucleoside triphosphate hydrolase protein n=1 Tax=Cucurbitaria berberidis CBS 394.84 TaxID=1168544 RepID=A0A9P4GUW0_9PLEO|nr:P-loop containing nucleoside triphosphate hydrolase protein [Cucurbitaria berberidis CBS 394.84]KAF1851800.1 P-loop containing nucleoside triphosphate hydrolase protein [Cucurbitaria berberidis CBS 394.84]
MNPPEENTDDGGTLTAGSTDEPFRLRPYQAEMVEESLKSNIIVVMDTGSGKTHIAIDRTRAELETCQPDQLVWFLAPTVTLCEQQYEVFRSNLPAYGIQLLCGKDGIDHWTEQSIWDAVLHGVRIVLSTHQVLLDALTHGFVKMGKLALLIFDEAHHCTLKHPARLIMSEFYTNRVEGGCSSLPKVLGLSASPVKTARATVQDLQQIEQNLHATAKTPKVHRSDLIRYVHKPELVQVSYRAEPLNETRSHLLLALESAFANYDLMTDPYVVDLLAKQHDGYDTSKQLQKTLISRKTYCSDQLRTLISKAKNMAQELGISAMEWYLHQCMTQFEAMVHASDQQLFDSSVDEKRHLLNILERLPFSSFTLAPPMSLDNISQKVSRLVDILAAEAHNNSGFTGLVFVEQRVWVAALAEILCVHPRTRELFQVGSFIGTSQSGKRKASIASFPEPKNQQTTLEDFRAGRTNLILTTSVLEEGIDVSSCHLVICFEPPKNLKSFVQRRGRARKQESKYFIFTSDTGSVPSSGSWQSLEAEMKATYENDMRNFEQAEKDKRQYEDGERFFEVPSTGALLTLDNAFQHLNHFCASLGSGAFVNTAPQFEFLDEQLGQTTARVILPTSIDSTVRSAQSLKSWRTERMAIRDAAFEAYKALYLAGLVNDNLLPARHQANEQAAQSGLSDPRPSVVAVSPTFDPWPSIARCQQNNPHVWHRTLLEVRPSEEEPMRMILLTPGLIPSIPEILLYWNETKRYMVKSSSLPDITLTDSEIRLLRSITWKVLQSVLYMENDTYDFLWLLAPCNPTGRTLSSNALSNWHNSTEGEQSALELTIGGCNVPADWGLVTHQGRKYILKTLNVSRPQYTSAVEETQLQAIRLPKRRDFLHPVPDNERENEAYTRSENLSASECIVGKLPASYSIFALLFPSILHRFEVHMIAEAARTTLLKPISFRSADLPIIVTALTSSATGEEDNYERLEFLGDTILKFIASVHLMADNLTWPESFLTGKKSKIVSNAFLARAALASGLDQFIITKRFTGAKWRAKCINQVLTDSRSPSKEEKSSKLVADVVESLIGASYVVGGLPKAFACIQTLLPLEDWIPIPEADQALYEAAPTQDTINSLAIVESLVGYKFTKKALLFDALTHASYTGPAAHCSYERLEFLGDAVLDYIVTKRLFESKLSHHTMHLIRSAIVTGSFLTYSMFETTVQDETTNKSTMQPEVHHRALWQFLRSGNQQLVAARDIALNHHMNAREQIVAALEHDATFPWHLLALIDAPKFLSDIVESVIGAIYVDSHGSIPACEVFVRRLGIVDCVDRIVRDQVDVTHPKVRLGILAVEKNVKYVQVKHDQGDDVSMNKMYRCQIIVGGESVGGIVEGLKRWSAETIAAWKAVGILERGVDAVMEDSEEDDVFFDSEEGGGVMVED